MSKESLREGDYVNSSDLRRAVSPKGEKCMYLDDNASSNDLYAISAAASK